MKKNNVKQVGTELGKAQLKLGLYFSLVKIYYMKKIKNQNLIVKNLGSFEKSKFINNLNYKVSINGSPC